MKTKKVLIALFSILIAINILVQCNTNKNKEYLVLTNDQLIDLGFVINEKGVFFKSLIPDKDTKITFEYVRMYLNSATEQGTRYIMNVGQGYNFEESLKSKENPTYSDSLPPLKLDYYFTKIVEVNGDMICDVEPRGVKTIPLLVRQSQYKFKIKKDVIVYMKLTDGLRKKLSYVDDWDDYIKVIPKEK
ncbi:MAG: hypothetical protein V1779_01165 [bacterium]